LFLIIIKGVSNISNLLKIYKKKSQSSVEFIVIVGISMVVLMFSSVLLFNYSRYSTGSILNSRVNEIGQSMVTNANIIYELGPPAKTVIEYNFPPLIDNISIVNDHLLSIRTSILVNSSYSGYDSPVKLNASFKKEDFTQGRKRFVFEAFDNHVEIKRLLK
jgi:hypothetical protein